MIYEGAFSYKICNDSLSEVHIYIDRSVLEEDKYEKTEGNCY